MPGVLWKVNVSRDYRILASHSGAMMTTLDITRLRQGVLPGESAVSLAQLSERRTKLNTRRSPFLKGPIPMEWLRTAAALPGKALAVGIELWFQSGLLRSNWVSVSMSRFSRHGVSRFAAARGLAALERAGLIRCLRAPGRKPRVEIISVVSDGVAEKSP